MTKQRASFNANTHQLIDDEVWSQLYYKLRPYVLAWIYSSKVAAWLGQEKDIADDILQEAIVRTHEYTQKIGDGVSHPIYSITSFSRTVAHNYFRDLRKRELRLLRLPDESTGAAFIITKDWVDPSDIALDMLSHQELLTTLARLIVRFPHKQRTALLIDLANISDFGEQATPLEQAFSAEGLQLRDYIRPPSSDQRERSRHAALLSIALKRLKSKMSG